MIRVGLMVAALGMIVACGPQGSGERTIPGAMEPLNVEASCLAATDNVCLNYISYPDNASAAELQQTCEAGEGTWSTKACSQENVFAQCRVLYMGGEVVTYFLPPKAPSEAETTCSNQNGTYKSRS